MVPLDATGTPPRRHVPPELIGLAGGVVGRNHGQLHHLFLKQGNAQGFPENGNEGRVGIFDFLVPVAPSQIGMHHAARDGSGAHNADFDHQVVITARL